MGSRRPVGVAGSCRVPLRRAGGSRAGKTRRNRPFPGGLGLPGPLAFRDGARGWARFRGSDRGAGPDLQGYGRRSLAPPGGRGRRVSQETFGVARRHPEGPLGVAQGGGAFDRVPRRRGREAAARGRARPDEPRARGVHRRGRKELIRGVERRHGAQPGGGLHDAARNGSRFGAPTPGPLVPS